MQAVDPNFGFTDPPFPRSLPMTLTLAAAGDKPAAVLTGPVTPAGGAWPIRRSGPADTCGMVRVSLQHRPLTALAALVWNGMLIGLCLNLIGINPIRALVFAAVFNGVIAVPLIWFINRIAARADTMGTARGGWLSRTVLAVTFLGMAAAVLAMALSYVHA